MTKQTKIRNQDESDNDSDLSIYMTDTENIEEETIQN